MLKLTQSTYKINNFFWISRSNSYSLSYHTPFPIAKGTKLQCTIEFPSPITHDGSYAGAKGKDGGYYWFTNGTDYVIKDGKMVINTTVNTTYDWTTLIGSFPTQGRGTVSSDGFGVGSINFENVSFVGDGPIIVQNGWTLTNSVGKVISKTNSFKNTSISYGNYTVTDAHNQDNVGGLVEGGKDKSTGDGYPSNTNFSGTDIIDIGTYPTYNLVDNSSGLGPTMPTGGAEAGITNWNPTYSSTVYNPVTGSAVIDVSGQGDNIQLFYPISYSGNSWKNGIIFTFFVKVSSNYTGSDSPFNFIGVNLDSRVLNGSSNVDGGTTSFTSPELSSLNSKWFAGYWYEIAFFISDVSSLPSRAISGVGFNLSLNTGGTIQYFSDPGVYPVNYWATFEPGFLIPSVG